MLLQQRRSSACPASRLDVNLCRIHTRQAETQSELLRGTQKTYAAIGVGYQS
jgi:hypothetical protein